MLWLLSNQHVLRYSFLPEENGTEHMTINSRELQGAGNLNIFLFGIKPYASALNLCLSQYCGKAYALVFECLKDYLPDAQKFLPLKISISS